MKSKPANVLRYLIQFVHGVRRLYWYLVRPETIGVRAIALDQKGDVILVRHAYSEGLFLPGGKVGRRENPEEAILRELREEIGLTAYVSLSTFATYRNFKEYKRDTVHLYVLEGVAYNSAGSIEIREVLSCGLTSLPQDISPATRRRLAQFQNDDRRGGGW